MSQEPSYFLLLKPAGGRGRSWDSGPCPSFRCSPHPSVWPSGTQPSLSPLEGLKAQQRGEEAAKISFLAFELLRLTWKPQVWKEV